MTGSAETNFANIESRLLNIDLEVQKVQEEKAALEEELLTYLGGSDSFVEEGYAKPEIIDLEGEYYDVDAMSLETTPAGNLSVSQGHFWLPGFDCGDNATAWGGVHIYFPSALDATYPIVSFLHGSGSGRLVDLCYSIASLGIVVVAVDKGVCGDWTLQQKHAVVGSQENQDAHAALSHVDYTRVGVIGHSEGACFTTGSAARAHEFNVKAAVMSHGASPNAAANIPKDVPVMFVTGSKDSRGRNHKIWSAFKAAPGRPDLFVNVAGATHMAPAKSGPMNAMDAHFLGCYLIPSQDSCDHIYGGGPKNLPGVCHFRDMLWCEIAEDSNLPELQNSAPAYDYELSGDYPISSGGYNLPGFDCGNGQTQDGGLRIWFPTSAPANGQKWPIVSFLHGSGGGVFGDLCGKIASHGVVVVAVVQGTCGDLSAQQLHAVFGSQEHQDLHEALPLVDYESVGIIGHSMGGAYTMQTATWDAKGHHIKAAVISHGASDTAAPSIPSDLPIMFVGGSYDKKTRFLWYAYNDTPEGRRVWTDITGDNHMAPLHGSPMNEYMAHFFACYLVSSEESCDMIYGEGPESVCKFHDMTGCIIDRSILKMTNVKTSV